MERTEVLDMMSGLKLYGMRSAYDETLATALKRKHEPQRFVGDLLKAEISEKQARSIKYQLTVAKPPLAKDVEDFAFKDTLINEALARDLAGGAFPEVSAERPITVMFCDLVGSTHLAAKLDAEDWRNLVNAYLDEATKAVTGLGGHVLKKLGDGLMALFGCPRAQENDAERAVRAALASSARSLGLQAALKLAKLYQSTGRPAEAHAVLAPALEGFAPTREMPEIAEAEALLSRLA